MPEVRVTAQQKRAIAKRAFYLNTRGNLSHQIVERCDVVSLIPNEATPQTDEMYRIAENLTQCVKFGKPRI